MPASLPLLDALQRTSGTEVPDVRHISLAAGEFVARTEVRDGVLKQAVLDLEPDRMRRETVVRALVVSGGAGLLLAALGGAWIRRRAVRPLAEALVLQRRFVADASHELRTPVTLLSTRAQLMRWALHAGAEPRLARGEPDGLVEDTAALAEVLDDLLLAAAPGAETGGAVVNLVEMARRGRGARDLGGGGTWVALSCTDGPAVAVVGSRAALRRAMTALVDNAIRHARSEVRLSVTVAGRRALVDVCDDGPGVDPEILPRLFGATASVSHWSARLLRVTAGPWPLRPAQARELAFGSPCRSYTSSSKKTPRTAKDPSSDANSAGPPAWDSRERGGVEPRRSRWWLVS